MAARVDLHLHTTASDGRLHPSELVRLVVSRGLRIIAITDHDSTEGLAPALKEATAHPELTVIPGVELSTDIPGSEVHILGYFVAYDSPRFQRALVGFRQAREIRARGMVQKLTDQGLPLEWERVKELAGDGAIGRPHIAQAMVEKGYIALPQDAFAKYIGRNGPAYVEREKLTPEEAVGFVLEHQGVPVLAHPAYVNVLQEVLPKLKQAGLMGMEVYYGDHTPETVKALRAQAALLGLLALGGSDYHALGTPGEIEPGQVGPPLEQARRLIGLARTEKPLPK
ncbi:MAG: PHP domain-containing protein [Chloroflexi bacterium]|nr:PHP domain-containing protein [Chloroflexota bacterium]